MFSSSCAPPPRLLPPCNGCERMRTESWTRMGRIGTDLRRLNEWLSFIVRSCFYAPPSLLPILSTRKTPRTVISLRSIPSPLTTLRSHPERQQVVTPPPSHSTIPPCPPSSPAPCRCIPPAEAPTPTSLAPRPPRTVPKYPSVARPPPRHPPSKMFESAHSVASPCPPFTPPPLYYHLITQPSMLRISDSPTHPPPPLYRH